MTWTKGEPIIYQDDRPTHWLAVWKENFMLPTSLARPLYDTANGGPPRAWECLVCPHALTDKARDSGRLPQGRVVLPTEKGMRIHLVTQHPQLQEQLDMFDDGNHRPGYQGDLAPKRP
jgi:hypothetical protein